VPLRIHKINLTQFRSYEALRLDTGGAPFVIMTGRNGAGKTNILEAVSLLAPGRGLRGAQMAEIKNRTADAQELWAVAAEVETTQGETLRIGTGQDRDGKRRAIRIDGKDVKTQNELADLVAAVWLTPQMDRIFLDGAAARRKFLDRLVFAHAPEHAGRLSRHERNLRERMALLQAERPADPRWISELENQIAADSISISAARRQVIDQLQNHIRHDSSFPAPALDVSGSVDKILSSQKALAAEDELRQRLARNRDEDRMTGRTQEGAHRADFVVRYAEKDMDAAQCSTGEQKGLLISLVLAHARMMQSEKGFVPLLLLDEVAAHLDDPRREELFQDLLSFKGQIWMTGTEVRIFSSLQKSARLFHVDHGRAAEEKFRAVG